MQLASGPVFKFFYNWHWIYNNFNTDFMVN